MNEQQMALLVAVAKALRFILKSESDSENRCAEITVALRQLGYEP